MNCSPKNVQNWFGNQRKLCKRREKKKISSIKTQFTSLRVSSYKKIEIKRREAVKIELIKIRSEVEIKREEEGNKKQEGIKKEEGVKQEYIKKEEAKSLPLKPIYNFNMNNQINFLPSSQPYHPTAQKNEVAMRNLQILNMHYSYPFLSMFSAQRLPPFDF